MPRVTYRGEAYALRPGESVLDCLERVGRAPPSSCRAGHCQSCLVRASAGEVPPAAQVGLKDTWKLQGLFLACVCKPEGDLDVVDATDAGLAVEATVVGRETLSSEVVRLRLTTREPFAYRAGQFVNLIRPGDQLIRPYSIASLPSDGALEVHVRRIVGGRMSPWLCDEVPLGAVVHLRGPAGACFYAAQPDQTLLLGGTSTGLAPLLGVLRDALAQGHRGRIVLYHGSVRESGLYLADELAALRAAHDNLEVVRCVLQGPASDGVQVGALDEMMLSRSDLARARAWLCGAPELVEPLKKRLFLAGMSLRAIATDPFLRAPEPPR